MTGGKQMLANGTTTGSYCSKNKTADKCEQSLSGTWNTSKM